MELNDSKNLINSKYDKIITAVFFENFRKGSARVIFSREQLVNACDKLKISRIKNLGDIPYSYRFRKELPDEILKTQPSGAEWIITGTGIGHYEFRLAFPSKVKPSSDRMRIKIPDATPEIVKKYAPGTDEQALLSKVRYNRLVDLFTGLTCYSIQNHLRTTVKNIGQIEIDEIYIGLNKRGSHYVIPCQAKSMNDRFGIVQVMQDLEFCRLRFPKAICKSIALQFISAQDLAILELGIQEDDEIFRLTVVEERHYRLVDQDLISDSDVEQYCSIE